jgi:alpha-glucoside transport system substrate-binding protein
MRPQSRKRSAILSAVAVTSLLAAGCTPGGGGGAGGGGDDFDGTVTIWASVDPPVLAGLEKGLAPLAEEAGVEVEWQRVDNINQLIIQRLQAGDAPEIAFIPQPGVVGDIAGRNQSVALDDVVDTAALEESLVPGALDAGTVDDELHGLLVSMNVKSLVLYPKKAFEAGGYEAPTTLDELVELTNQIKADGITPWCMGIESDTATGWPATDWFEDLVMRFGGADVYNQWVTHEIPFNDEVVQQSGEYFAELMFTEGNVLGGRQAIASTNFGTGGNPMFQGGNKPRCMMYKQGSFITGFFPENIVNNLDEEVGVFGFPPAEAGGESPVLGGGDLAVMLADNDETGQVMEMLGNPEMGNPAAEEPSSSFISPHKEFDTSLYQSDFTRDVAAVAYEATAFLFDGSDQMPGEVGAGSFWRELTAWISGDKELGDALTAIEESWPS